MFGRLTGGAGAKPQTVEEQVKLMDAENERLKALAELDKPAESISPWVADLRASFQYIAAGVVIMAAVSTLHTPKMDAALFEAIWNHAGSVFSFMFGDRMYFKFVKR